MTDAPDSPRRRRRPAPPPPPPAGSAAKGAALVVVAVLIGFWLLRDDSSSNASLSNGSPGVTAVDESTTTSSSSTTTAPLRDRNAVRVLVANGTDVQGAASGVTDELKARNYVTANPTNSTAVATTEIHYQAGYEGEALRLAIDLGIDASAVRQLTTPAPVDMQESNLLVILGPDRVATS